LQYWQPARQILALVSLNVRHTSGLQPTFYNVSRIGRGALAIMGRPVAGEWVSEEFRGLAGAGFNMVVSLLESKEAFELGLGEESRFCAEANLRFASIEIPDRGVPSDVDSFARLCHEIHSTCDSGERIVAHCRAGIGRSALFAASVMVLAGFQIDQAFRTISEARGVEVPDTPEQVQWLRENERRIRASGCA
jgi:protein-tyrosine phosphatase